MHLFFFLLFAWSTIFSFGLSIFRFQPLHYINQILISTLIMTTIGVAMNTSFKYNENIHFVNSPLEMIVLVLLFVLVFKFHWFNSYGIVLILYGIITFLENTTAIVFSDFQLELASATILDGVDPEEWIFLVLMFLTTIMLVKKKWGFTFMKLYKKPKMSRSLLLLLFIGSIMIWFTSISVHFHFHGELFLLSTILIFIVIIRNMVSLYKFDISEDF